MTKRHYKKYRGLQFHAMVGEIGGGRFHALVAIDYKNGSINGTEGFVEVPSAETYELALEIGWRCAEHEIDAKLKIQ